MSEKMSDGVRPVVFLDITIGGENMGRIKIELYSDLVPKAADNFRQLCTGEQRRRMVPFGYKNASFHRIIRGQIVYAGADCQAPDGSSALNIYGSATFDEKNQKGIQHDKPGLVTMINASNGCEFAITTSACPWLDSSALIVGTVVDGMLTVHKLENTPVAANSKPALACIISQCGEM
uniref:Peptidyl-prolyl cis-trans isomerase n=1 Tax=Timspurckia oligopyrenoides TaxID=708627 RepID=A0A6T6LRZ7_9RHOD|mmetsp:Transcript_11923/g.21601  ORF Transcript_11923/g.21601 Transcript_11923/m.21601 type:complete len:178 (+) Transcript_11923:113-646(+)